MNNFWCKNSECRSQCTLCNEKGDLTTEESKAVCPSSGKPLKLMGRNLHGGVIGLSREKVLAQRRMRNKKHFINNDLGEIKDKDVRRHLMKKHGKKD